MASLAGALATVLGLAGCNSLVSTDPWYTRADAARAPQLRDGLWRLEDPSQPCSVDEAKPIGDWPDCTGALFIRGARLTLLSDKGGEHAPETMEFLVAAGDPMIVQLHDPEAKTNGFAYLWLRATKLDDRRRAIAIRGWTVACKPPPATNQADATNAAPPPAHYPGLSDQDGNCTADSRASVQAAAAASERDFPSDVTVAHWVRDGER